MHCPSRADWYLQLCVGGREILTAQFIDLFMAIFIDGAYRPALILRHLSTSRAE